MSVSSHQSKSHIITMCSVTVATRNDTMEFYCISALRGWFASDSFNHTQFSFQTLPSSHTHRERSVFLTVSTVDGAAGPCRTITFS
ncbi:unnamed protein product [Leuciscus chuanchicus]